MAETAKARMEGISDKASTFTRATHVEHVKGMFKVLNYFQIQLLNTLYLRPGIISLI